MPVIMFYISFSSSLSKVQNRQFVSVFFTAIFMLALCLCGGVATAKMEKVDEGSLAEVYAQDGISMNIVGLSMPSGLRYSEDDSAPGAQDNYIELNNPTWQTVGNNGVSVGAGTPSLNIDIDFASNAADSEAALIFGFTFARHRFSPGELNINSPIAQSFGDFAIDLEGTVGVALVNGFLNSAENSSSLTINIPNADLYYQDGTQELVVDGLALNLDMGSITLGASASGFTFNSANSQGSLSFSALHYRDNPASKFRVDNADPRYFSFDSNWSFSAAYTLAGGGSYNRTGAAGGAEGLKLTNVAVAGISPASTNFSFTDNDSGNSFSFSNLDFQMNINQLTFDIVNSTQDYIAIEAAGLNGDFSPGDIALGATSLGKMNVEYDMDVSLELSQQGVAGGGDDGFTAVSDITLRNGIYAYGDPTSLGTNGGVFTWNDLDLTMSSTIHLDLHDAALEGGKTGFGINNENINLSWTLAGLTYGAGATSIGSITASNFVGSSSVWIVPK